MLRELITNTGKIADATCTADVALVRGMAVQKLNGEAVLPTAATGEGLFFVDKEQVPTGLDTLKGEISDYDDIFEKIAANSNCKLIKYYAGEQIATDQVTGTIADGTYVVAGTDGKLKAAVAGNVAYAVSRGAYDDNGHALTKIEFVEAHTVA
jgi:hypothetical protein